MLEYTEGHTVKRYDSELAHLRNQLLEMGGLVLDQVHQATELLDQIDLAKARRVVERDREVNALDVKTDEHIVDLIARRSPLANDLRTILSIAKAVADLERIGDETVKIARMILRIYDADDSPPNTALLRDARAMGKMASTLLRDSLNAFDTLDVNTAVQVAQWDQKLDNEFQAAMRRLASYILEDSRNLRHTLNVVLIIKALERIGDHAKNVAEYVVYLVKGKDVRHITADNLADEVFPAGPDAGNKPAGE